MKERDYNTRYSSQICGHILFSLNLIQVYIPVHLNMKTVSAVSNDAGMYYLVTGNNNIWMGCDFEWLKVIDIFYADCFDWKAISGNKSRGWVHNKGHPIVRDDCGQV